MKKLKFCCVVLVTIVNVVIQYSKFLHTIFLKSERSLSTARRECDNDRSVISGHMGSFPAMGGHFRSLGVTSLYYGAISDITSPF
jgi:hypothetical protein